MLHLTGMRLFFLRAFARGKRANRQTGRRSCRSSDLPGSSARGPSLFAPSLLKGALRLQLPAALFSAPTPTAPRRARGGEPLQLLLAGEVQLTTANGSNVVQRNAEGKPIVAIALIGQKSEQGFAVLQSSGIAAVKDWEGKTFGYKGSVATEFLATVKANGVDAAKVKQQAVSFDPRVLSEGLVDILAVFVSNEPDTLTRLGFPTTGFDPSDYDITAPRPP